MAGSAGAKKDDSAAAGGGDAPKSKKGDKFDRLRSRIKEQLDEQAKRRRIEMFRHRIDIARSGIASYEKGNVTEAINNFQTYLKILEDWKQVQPGGLKPSLFDAKEDEMELLLICGIYWDMAKIYDRSEKKRTEKEFREYMAKFVLFSKGQSLQAISAESLRKYIACNKALHRSDFNRAYEKLRVNNCFIAGALAEHLDPQVIPTLRDFRDQRLMVSSWGRRFTDLYYTFSPRIAIVLNDQPAWIKKPLAAVLEKVTRLLNHRSRS